VVAAADHTRIGRESGWLVGYGTLELFADVGEFVNFAMEVAEKFAAADGRGRDEIFESGKSCEGFAKGDEFAWAGLAESDSAGETFEVLNSAKFFADFAAHHGLLDEVGDGIEAGFNGFAVNEWAKNPGAEKTRAHARNGDVERRKERGGSIFARVIGKDRGEELKIADRDGVEDESFVLLVEADVVEVLQCVKRGMAVCR